MRSSKPLVAVLLLHAIAASAAPDIPENYDAAPSLSKEAVELSNRCVPGTSEAAYMKMVKDAGASALVANRPSDLSKPYLLVNATRTICVAMSQKQYPLLAQEAFDETIDFPEMSAADRKSLKASLAGQIARTGTALALIKNDKGNAYAISYLLTANRPTKIYYQASFLKAGEFDEAKYEVVLTAPGSMNVTGRGQPSEQFKPLFQK